MMFYYSGIISKWERDFYDQMIQLYEQEQYNVKYTFKQMQKMDEVEQNVLSSKAGRCLLYYHYGESRQALLAPMLGIIRLYGKAKDKWHVLTNEPIPEKEFSHKLKHAVMQVIWKQRQMKAFNPSLDIVATREARRAELEAIMRTSI